MLNSSSVRIDVNDLLEELREENNTLFKQLLFAQKCQKLLQKYRNNLNNVYINCKCDQNFENKLIFNNLEIEYKCISEEYSQEFNNNLKAIKNNFEEKSINNNTNKRTLNEITINQSFNKKHNIFSNNESNNEFSINENLEKSETKADINNKTITGNNKSLNKVNKRLNNKTKIKSEIINNFLSNEELFDQNFNTNEDCLDFGLNKTHLKSEFNSSKTSIKKKKI
jgi:hypothetical protein